MKINKIKYRKGTIHKVCIICGIYFPIKSSSYRHKRMSPRPKIAITCSKEHSRLYGYRYRHNMKIMRYINEL